MKCFIAVLLLALFAVAYAGAIPVEPEKFGAPLNAEALAAEAPRDKRGVVLSYTAPLSYLPYTVPYTYRTYPYFYSSYF